MANAPKKHEIDRLFSAAYDELRRLAATIKGRQDRVTLDPTGLVNEAWIRLSKSDKVAAQSLPQFKRTAARAIRRILIDLARARAAHKRGGPGAIFVTLGQSADQSAVTAEEVLRLEAALEELAAAEPRQAQIVEWRFFGGMTVDEIAVALDVSKTTVEGDWRVARAWLKHQLRPRPRAAAG